MDDISVGRGTAKAQDETEETCATCGRPLTQRGPNGECLRCLVSLTFLGDGSTGKTSGARPTNTWTTAIRPLRSRDRSRWFSG